MANTNTSTPIAQPDGLYLLKVRVGQPDVDGGTPARPFMWAQPIVPPDQRFDAEGKLVRHPGSVMIYECEKWFEADSMVGEIVDVYLFERGGAPGLYNYVKPEQAPALAEGLGLDINKLKRPPLVESASSARQIEREVVRNTATETRRARAALAGDVNAKIRLKRGNTDGSATSKATLDFLAAPTV